MWHFLCTVLIFGIGTGCKRSKYSTLDDDSARESATVTIAVQDQLPNELHKFLEVMAGRSDRMHDYYFNAILPKYVEAFGSISKTVTMIHEVQNPAAINSYNGPVVKVEHLYRGIHIGRKILVFRQLVEPGGVAERGPWWKPFRVYPSAILEGKSLEDKIRFALDADIYEKKKIGEMVRSVDAVEFACHLIPAYGGAEKYFYNDEKMGLAWMIGDIASLGMGSKINAVAKTARVVVIGASTIRIGGGVVSAIEGDFDKADGIELALASVEGGLALIGFANIRIPTKGGAAAKNLDELIDAMGSERVFVADRASADVLGRRLGRNIEDILAHGISREELARMANKKLLPKVEAATNGRVFSGAGSQGMSFVIEGLDLNRINRALQKIENGVAISFDEAVEISALGLNKSNGKLMWNVQKDLDVIYSDERVMNRFRANRTHVFATETPISLDDFRRAMIQGTDDGVRTGHVIFQGQAAQLFRSHPIWGFSSGLKRWVFKEFQTKGFGDLVIDAAERVDDTTLVVTKAHIASSADAGGAFATGVGPFAQWSRQVLYVGSDLLFVPVLAVGGMEMVMASVTSAKAAPAEKSEKEAADGEQSASE